MAITLEKEFNRDGKKYLVEVIFRSSDHLELSERWDFNIKLWDGKRFGYWRLRDYDHSKNPAINQDLDDAEKWKYITPEELHQLHLELWERMKPGQLDIPI